MQFMGTRRMRVYAAEGWGYVLEGGMSAVQFMGCSVNERDGSAHREEGRERSGGREGGRGRTTRWMIHGRVSRWRAPCRRCGVDGSRNRAASQPSQPYQRGAHQQAKATTILPTLLLPMLLSHQCYYQCCYYQHYYYSTNTALRPLLLPSMLSNDWHPKSSSHRHANSLARQVRTGEEGQAGETRTIPFNPHQVPQRWGGMVVPVAVSVSGCSGGCRGLSVAVEGC